MDNNGLKYVYAQRNDDADLIYTVQTRDMFTAGVSWTNEGYTVVLATNITGGVYDYVTNSVPTTDPVKFIRVKIEN